MVGVGWAGEQHADAYAKLPGVELAGIAGLEEPVRTELAERLGVERHVATWEELLEDESLDVVSVAVPTFLHTPIAIAALERGLHVLCEKPIARTPEEAAAMVAAAEKAGRILDVAFNRRQRNDIQALRRLIEAGRLGKPYYTKAWWLRRSGIPTLGSWFTSRETAGGGPLVDLGVHLLDYALFLIGQPKVTTVSASTYDLLGSAGFGGASIPGKTGGSGEFDVEDLASAFLRLDDGGTLLVETSWATHRTDDMQFGITIYGTEGGAELRVDETLGTGTLTVFSEVDGVPAVMQLDPEPGGGHDEVVEQFLDAVRAGEGGQGAAAAELARVVDACYRSAEAGREIALS
ncbi:Gfo/Idh/MocA family protein [Solirubrobacter deserti]|uniref:Gfo/Idh/MocA family oxidoreductase n=1 Tax=Solirubrobacter deserti TaxID=2282478 RepID=A0ABT4RLB7_9ACTN|nr:Gfo/Idh/MocA family oxidoreductase [Solirubrobacter deserti]MDA0139361.1 Gfo/Idh/MocA family oxidoreductase [Solirubrobacter deserti]